MMAWIVIAAVIAGALYEGVALSTRRVPTITDLMTTNWATALLSLAVIVLASGWAVLHVMESV